MRRVINRDSSNKERNLVSGGWESHHRIQACPLDKGVGVGDTGVGSDGIGGQIGAGALALDNICPLYLLKLKWAADYEYKKF